MYRLLSVVLILLGVYLVTQVLYPLRERLEPTNKIKAPTVKDELGNLSYSPDEIDRIWSMVENPSKAVVSWDGEAKGDGTDDVTKTKKLIAGWVGNFYLDVYSQSKVPITKKQIKEYLDGYVDPAYDGMNTRFNGRMDSLHSLYPAYFIDQADPPTPAAPTTSTPVPAPAVTSTPAPIDVTGPTTITINVK